MRTNDERMNSSPASAAADTRAGHPPARPSAVVVTWPRAALLAILTLSAGLNLSRLTAEGFGNPYYAATVRSMLTGWRNFFFAAYDPGGFVSVD